MLKLDAPYDLTSRSDGLAFQGTRNLCVWAEIAQSQSSRDTRISDSGELIEIISTLAGAFSGTMTGRMVRRDVFLMGELTFEGPLGVVDGVPLKLRHAAQVALKSG